MNDAEDNTGNTEGDLSEEHRANVKQLKEIMVEKRTDAGIMFEKVYKKVLNVQTDRVNEATKYLKSKCTTEMNKLIRAKYVRVAEMIGLKKAEHRDKIIQDRSVVLMDI